MRLWLHSGRPLPAVPIALHPGSAGRIGAPARRRGDLMLPHHFGQTVIALCNKCAHLAADVVLLVAQHEPQEVDVATYQQWAQIDIAGMTRMYPGDSAATGGA